MTTSQEPAPAVVGRCPTCGARLRSGDQWCTLCLTPVPPRAGIFAPEPVEPREPEETAEAPHEDDDAGQPADQADEADRADEVDEAAERLLAELRMRETHRLPPRLAAIRPRTKGAEAMLAGLGALVMVGVLFVTLYVVGRFL